MSQLVQAEPPIQPEPTPGTPNNQYNPPSTEPEPEQELPVWLTIDQVNDQYLSDLSVPYQFTDQMLTFKGRTNILDAVIFIRLSSNPNVVYTTYSYNDSGYWQWSNPYSLDFGSHFLEITAMSPRDPSINTTESLYFDVVPEILVEPEPEEPEVSGVEPVEPEIPEPEEPVVPSEPVIQPQEPIIPIIPGYKPGELEAPYDIFGLNIEILNKNNSLYPNDQLKTKIDFQYFGQQENQLLNLKFYVLDNQQQIIMTADQPVLIEKRLIFFKNFETSFTIKPGRYTIIVEFEYNGQIIQSSQNFFVKKQPLLGVLPLIVLSFSDIEISLLLIIITSLLFIFFFILFYYDQKRGDKKYNKITVEDLIKQHYFDIK